MSTYPTPGDVLSAEIRCIEDDARSKPLTATQARVLLRNVAGDFEQWLRMYGTLTLKHWPGCEFVRTTVEKARKKGRTMESKDFRGMNATIDDMLTHVFDRRL